MEADQIKREGLIDRIKNSSLVKKLRSVKNIQIIIAIFIIAIALIIYSNVISDKKTSGQEATVQMTSEEQRLSAILSAIEGAGDVETMITSRDGSVIGVLVIAEGAQNITVRLRLIEATASALGIDRSAVRVYGKGQA